MVATSNGTYPWSSATQIHAFRNVYTAIKSDDFYLTISNL